jgi:hypothetical protein
MLNKVDFGTYSLALLTILCQAEAQAQTVQTTIGKYFTNVAGSTLTRANNTATYSANQTVCAATATTICVPGTISIAAVNNGIQFINRVTLLKSGSATASANFTIWLFSAAPGTATPNQFDATAYSGPRIADMPNYIGNAACNTPLPTSDSTAGVWFECTLSNPNTAGALAALAQSGTNSINYLLSVTAAYAPAASETFTPYVTGFY